VSSFFLAVTLLIDQADNIFCHWRLSFSFPVSRTKILCVIFCFTIFICDRNDPVGQCHRTNWSVEGKEMSVSVLMSGQWEATRCLEGLLPLWHRHDKTNNCNTQRTFSSWSPSSDPCLYTPWDFFSQDLFAIRYIILFIRMIKQQLGGLLVLSKMANLITPFNLCEGAQSHS